MKKWASLWEAYPWSLFALVKRWTHVRVGGEGGWGLYVEKYGISLESVCYLFVAYYHEFRDTES